MAGIKVCITQPPASGQKVCQETNSAGGIFFDVQDGVPAMAQARKPPGYFITSPNTGQDGTTFFIPYDGGGGIADPPLDFGLATNTTYFPAVQR